jgi:hypothetical protein
MTAVATVATYCGSVAVAVLREASLIAAATLLFTRGALDERRLVGTAASDLSTLAGARGGGHGRHHPASAKTKKSNPHPSRTGCLGE